VDVGHGAGLVGGDGGAARHRHRDGRAVGVGQLDGRAVDLGHGSPGEAAAGEPVAVRAGGGGVGARRTRPGGGPILEGGAHAGAGEGDGDDDGSDRPEAEADALRRAGRERAVSAVGERGVVGIGRGGHVCSLFLSSDSGGGGADHGPPGGGPTNPPPPVMPLSPVPPEGPEPEPLDEDAVPDTVPIDITTWSPADRPETISVVLSPFSPSVTARVADWPLAHTVTVDRKSTRLNSS